MTSLRWFETREQEQAAFDRLWRALSDFVGERRRLTRIEKLVIAGANLHAPNGFKRALLDAAIMCMHPMRGSAPAFIACNGVH